MDGDSDDVNPFESEVRLINYLLDPSRYNKYAIPSIVDDDEVGRAVPVEIHVAMKSLDDVSSGDQVMISVLDVYMYWKAPNLNWNDSAFGNTVDIYLKADDIWVPDLTIENTIVKDFKLIDRFSLINVFKDEDDETSCIFEGFTLVTTMCDIDVRYFPVDVQACSIELTNQFTAASRANFSFLDLSTLVEYNNDGTWKMIGTKLDKTVVERTAGARSKITITFLMERRSLFYLVSLLLPVLFLSATSCLVFALPADSGEKLGTAITVLLAYAVYLTIVTDYLPETSLQVALQTLKKLTNKHV